MLFLVIDDESRKKKTRMLASLCKVVIVLDGHFFDFSVLILVSVTLSALFSIYYKCIVCSMVLKFAEWERKWFAFLFTANSMNACVQVH